MLTFRVILDPPSFANTSSPEETAALTELIHSLGPDPSRAHHVLRRNFPTRFEPDPRSTIPPGAAQSRERSLGPFVGPDGRRSFIDIITPTPTKLISFQRTGSSTPFLLLEAPNASRTVSSISLTSGSIWCAAHDFSDESPQTSFIGLQIQSGTASFSSPVKLTGSLTTVASTVKVTITLRFLASTQESLIDGASVSLPTSATLILSSSGSRLESAGQSSLTAFGTTVDTSYQSTAARYDSVLDRLLFPLQVTVENFPITQSSSQLFSFSGNAEIITAAWSIPVTTDISTSLGGAAGVGGLSLTLGQGILGLPSDPSSTIDCGLCTLLVEPATFVVSAIQAKSQSSTKTISLFGKSSFNVRLASPFPFRYISEPSNTEAWAMTTSFTSNLDQPQTISGDGTRLSGSAVTVFFRIAGTTTVSITGNNSAAGQQTQSFALKNLLFSTQAADSLSINGTYANQVLTTGSVILGFEALSALPFLPDPYTTNADTLPALRAPSSPIKLTMTVKWVPATPVTIDITLPGAGPSSTGTVESSSVFGTLVDGKKLPSTLTKTRATISRDIEGGRAVAGYLDLSTNVSQFGVLAGITQFDVLPSLASATMSIEDLFLQAPNNAASVFALPAVQWEPVVTSPNEDNFPSPLTFPDCGEPFLMTTKSVTLVPVAPRQALDGIISNYNSGAAQEVTANFTLPFGMQAEATLQPSDEFLIPSPGLTQVQPTFTKASLQGTDQISFTPPRRRIIPIVPRGLPQGDSASPSIPGSTEQLSNAQVLGTATPSTVLDTSLAAFNQTFATGGSSPSVPITRVDISGYGESTFSDWRNPVDAAATISKVAFNVIVGRTSREVVQIYTVMYPFAVRVVKTITINRLSNGTINRSESNWTPVSNGLYQYPHLGITTHVGVVSSVLNITNIRDTGSIYKTQDGSQLEAVFFDCGIQIENVFNGAGADGTVPGRNLIGYVQISDRTALPPLGQLDPPQYAELIQNVGPMCGQIDCVINVGGSGLLMTVKRMGITSSSTPAGTIEFVMEVGGAPLLPSGGLWSFVSLGTSDVSPIPVDAIDGVPLVRQNVTATTPATAFPYIFQHGTDLLPSSPSTIICLLHSTGTQRVIFPQVKIEAIGPPQLTSIFTPVLADPHALASSATGPFPHINLCIPFPSPNYSILIRSDGSLKLQLPQPNFQVTIGPRVLRSSKTLVTRSYCQDENGTPSTIAMTIDTAAAIPWTFSITNVMVTTASGSLGEVIKVVGDMTADSQTPTQLKNSRVILGGSMKPVQDVVSFLQQFGKIPGPTVSMTNDWQIDVILKCDLKEYINSQDPGLGSILEVFLVDFDFTYGWQFSAEGTSHDSLFEVTIKVPTGIGPIVAIALASFEIHMDDSGPSEYTFTLGAGIGVNFLILGGFEVLAYWAVTQSIIAGEGIFGIGAGTLVKGSIDLKVVEVDVEAEASMALIRVVNTIWGVAQITLAVDITIFWVLQIDFGWTHQWQNNFNGGPDQLPG